jgi:hypothetical protein
LFLALTDSFVAGFGRGVPRMQLRIVDRRLYGKIAKLLTNNKKEKLC